MMTRTMQASTREEKLRLAASAPAARGPRRRQASRRLRTVARAAVVAATLGLAAKGGLLVGGGGRGTGPVAKYTGQVAALERVATR
jgi:hypothetical protein